jgi:hypothetical protein
MKNDLKSNLLLPKVKISKEIDICGTVNVVAKQKEITNPDGSKSILGTWDCDPKSRNRLCWTGPNDPVIAREVHYAFGKIAWSAGQGWPTYYVPQPLNNYDDSFYYPGFPRHSIVLEFGGIYSQTGNMQGGDRGNRATEVFAQVNDDQYGDNTGVFTVNITAYSQS